MAAKAAIHTLHRYFIWADRMRVHFDAELRSGRPASRGQIPDIDQFLYMSYWYGGMYVVVEGWQALGLHDPDVDRLLGPPHEQYVTLLRRYRDGAFHFQKTYFDGRFVSFWSDRGTAKWIRDLREAISNFFLSTLDAWKQKTKGECQ